ncbi:MAG: methyltransferase domain-containing protein [Zoogloeaceae bacterium]|jgi:malonyl-CoA O-methyltransferase|nr:methyltransferase domain-containing protein [Zoogloeaceae bacterium]
MTPQGARLIDRAAVRRNFRRVAATYGAADFVAREVDARMQERLNYVRLTPEWIVDLGCGPGLSLPGLQGRYPKARCLGVDGEPAMLPRQISPAGWRHWLPEAAKTTNMPQFLAADACRLPLCAQSADLLWSNLLLPWLADPLAFFRESLRCLKTGGLLMFSALGPDTLKELRGGFARDGFAHTQRFADLHDLGDLLLEAGFADPVMDMEILTLTYPTLDKLLADLRETGATCAMQDRRRGLAGKTLRQNLEQHYETLRQQEKLPATLEILYGHAWKPAPRITADGREILRFKPRR